MIANPESSLRPPALARPVSRVVGPLRVSWLVGSLLLCSAWGALQGCREQRLELDAAHLGTSALNIETHRRVAARHSDRGSGAEGFADYLTAELAQYGLEPVGGGPLAPSGAEERWIHQGRHDAAPSPPLALLVAASLDEPPAAALAVELMRRHRARATPAAEAGAALLLYGRRGLEDTLPHAPAALALGSGTCVLQLRAGGAPALDPSVHSHGEGLAWRDACPAAITAALDTAAARGRVAARPMDAGLAAGVTVWLRELGPIDSASLATFAAAAAP